MLTTRVTESSAGAVETDIASATAGGGSSETVHASVHGPLEAAFAAAAQCKVRFDQPRHKLPSTIAIKEGAQFQDAKQRSGNSPHPEVSSKHHQSAGIWCGPREQTAPRITGCDAEGNLRDAEGNLCTQPASLEPKLSSEPEFPSKPAILEQTLPDSQPLTLEQTLRHQKKLPRSQDSGFAPSQRQTLQRLRTLDNYVNPEATSITYWLCTAWNEWCLRQKISLVSRLFGKDDVRVIPHLNALAKLLHQRRQVDQSEELHVHCLALRQHYYGRNHESCAESLSELAKINRDQGRYEQSEQLWRQAINLLADHYNKVAFLTASGLASRKAQKQAVLSYVSTLNDLALLLDHQGRPTESKKHLEKALEICARTRSWGIEELHVAENITIAN